MVLSKSKRGESGSYDNWTGKIAPVTGDFRFGIPKRTQKMLGPLALMFLQSFSATI